MWRHGVDWSDVISVRGVHDPVDWNVIRMQAWARTGHGNVSSGLAQSLTVSLHHLVARDAQIGGHGQRNPGSRMPWPAGLCGGQGVDRP